MSRCSLREHPVPIGACVVAPVNKRILIVGHGNAGQTLARDIRSRGGGDVVVGFLDDAVTGPEVLGSLAAVNAVIAEHDVTLVSIAMPSAEARIMREFIASIKSSAVELTIVPRTYDIIRRETVHIDDVTDVDMLDLVGRTPVKHQLDAAREFVRGKTVLVTGAAGSIGSRLVAQLTLLKPALVVCVDRWENGVFALQLALADASACTTASPTSPTCRYSTASWPRPRPTSST